MQPASQPWIDEEAEGHGRGRLAIVMEPVASTEITKGLSELEIKSKRFIDAVAVLTDIDVKIRLPKLVRYPSSSRPATNWEHKP